MPSFFTRFSTLYLYNQSIKADPIPLVMNMKVLQFLESKDAAW